MLHHSVSTCALLFMLLKLSLRVFIVTPQNITNLMNNGDFEEPSDGSWENAGGFTMDYYTGDVYDGVFSLRCRDR